MIRVALRGVREHLVRFALSVLAVTLGVAFVVGTFAFRGMLSSTFDDIIATTLVADVYVRGADVVADDAPGDPGGQGAGGGLADQRSPVSAELVDDIERVDDVDRAVADVSGPVVLLGADGTAVVTNGPPSLAFAIDTEDPSTTLTDGQWPGTGEIALEASAADASGLSTGDTTTVVLGGGPQPVTVSGEFTIAAAAAGSILVGLDEATAREAYAPDGRVQYISVYARDGADVDAVRREVAAALPDGSGAQAVTGEVVREEAQRNVEEVLGFVETFLLVFAAIALVVGAFIISNAFAMSVRERQRELALLRAVGASPGQVFTSVLVQAIVVGVVGAAIGVAGGALLVRGIRAGLGAFGFELAGRIPLSTGQVVGAIGLGAVICLLAAVLPARRAALIPPVEALRDDVAPERGTRARAVGGIVLAALGGLALAVASRLGASVDGRVTGWQWLDDTLEPVDPRVVLGVGAGLLLLGVLVGSPAVARGVLRVLGAPLVPLLRPLGGIARGNVTRSPRRTAATAGALLIGMALVACTAVIAASTQASVRAIVDTEMRAPLIVDSATWVVPTGAVDAVRDVPGVGRLDVVRLGTTSASVASGEPASVGIAGVPDRFFETALDPVTLDGDATAALESGDAVVHRRTARDQGWKVGDELRIGLAEDPVEVRVGAVIDSQIVSDGLVVPDAVFDDVVPTSQQTVRAAYATPAAGTSVEELRSELRTAVEPFLVLTVRDRAETASAVSDQVDQVLAILYALLALSIVIALLGIVNTLALSVIERTREIGLLRAVGLGRLQLAGVIAIESVLIAVFGTVLGVAVGVAVGAALPGVLADEGLSTLAIPWTQVLLVLAAAVVIGLIASIGPAVRAARLPVLEAVTVD